MNESFPTLGLQEATRQTYMRLGAELAQRLCPQERMDAAVLVANFLAGSHNYSQRTFRRYKAALTHYLESMGAAQSVLLRLRTASSKGLAKRSNRTSGAKAKTVKPHDAEVLLGALRQRGSENAVLAADYFEAGLLLGPRPKEWVGAQLEVLALDDQEKGSASTHRVTLTNAKRDLMGVRGNGATREVLLTLSSHEAAVLARVISDAQRHAHDWPGHYERLRNALYYGAKTLWPTRKKVPSFYTTRHQSQANAKASGLPPNAVAAIYGHASDSTATTHYSRASSGDKKLCKTSPTAVSLAAVRSIKMTRKLETGTPLRQSLPSNAGAKKESGQ